MTLTDNDRQSIINIIDDKLADAYSCAISFVPEMTPVEFGQLVASENLRLTIGTISSKLAEAVRRGV